MKISIYDYANNATTVELKDKPINLIVVCVVSGDEVIDVIYKDGTREHHDSCSMRFMSFLDGCYVIEADKIKEWASVNTSNCAQDRLDKFWVE